ncbi:LysR family transcriptional regulator [Curvivirga sp.]|uniref:LysR family transcriptional regulator n=1 Tax=Curvivirga sp. TaxID=2856848 RepID=UPI003B5CB610
MNQLPSLQALKIFIITAQLNSFTKAADELGISQGAISQHIKNLEVRVGFKVFNREGRKVSLTPSGHELLVSANHNLNQIQRTIELEQLKQKKNEIVISVFPGFAIRWLLPRIMSFNDLHPDIKVELNTVSRPTDFNLFHAHAAISYAAEDDLPENADPLFEEELVPVCSPDFAKQHDLKLPLKKSDLEVIFSLPLLSDESPTANNFDDTWGYWAHKLGLTDHKNTPKKQSQSNITLQLAELGHGVALGRTSLIMDALITKRLVVMTETSLTNPCKYFIYQNPLIVANNSFEIFINWFLKESRKISDYRF